MIQDYDPGDEDPSMTIAHRRAAAQALLTKYPWLRWALDASTAIGLMCLGHLAQDQLDRRSRPG